MIFRQLFESLSSTYTYLLGDEGSGEALLIDPVFETARRDQALLKELDLSLLYTLDTHAHADHVTAAWLLRKRLGCRAAVSAQAGVQGADLLVQEGDQLKFGSHWLTVRETPGHTSGCGTDVLDDERMAFPGRAWLIRGADKAAYVTGSGLGGDGGFTAKEPGQQIRRSKERKDATGSEGGDDNRRSPWNGC